MTNTTGRAALIASYARTPFLRFNGGFASIPAAELGAHALRAALSRAGIGPEQVDIVQGAQVIQAAAGQNPARQAAVKAGIPIGGEITRDPTVRTSPEAWQTLAVNQTPIAQVIARANKDSMNLYAEALCKRLGAAASKGSGSWSNGPPAVGAFLQSIGVGPDQFSLDDGCGLSRKDTVSPGTLVAVLEHEYFSKNRDIYLNSLAIAGVDGTLKHRFDDTPMRHRVVGKSGFIDGVSALSGFVKSKDGSQYVFSILFNGIAKGTNSTAKDVQERIVMALN